MCECFDLEMDQLTDDAHLVKDLDVDSISVVEMIVELEDEFGIEINDKSTEEFLIVKDAISKNKLMIDSK